MAMEADTLTFISWGFYVVGGCSLLVIARLWMGSGNKSFVWFLAQLMLLYLSFLKFISTIKMKLHISPAMLSEENSLGLGISGTLWAASMFCMLMGLWNLCNRANRASSPKDIRC